MTTASSFTPEVLANALTYTQYRARVDERFANEQSTGPLGDPEMHTAAMLHYTKLNIARMQRLDKTITLIEAAEQAAQQLQTPLTWVVLTEGWCGDAAHNIPPLVKLAAAAEHITLRFLLRDEHLPIMDQYRTNGGRSIPKLVCLATETGQELGTWGPRPAIAQQKAMELKADESLSFEDKKAALQQWYNADKTESLQAEFAELIPAWAEKAQ